MKFKSTILLFIVLNTHTLFCQNLERDSIKNYIQQLGWTSFTTFGSYAPEIKTREEVKKLIELPKDNVAKFLFPKISNSCKTVIIHIIFSKIFEPENDMIIENYVRRGDTIITINFTYNNLNWQYDLKTGDYSIQRNEVDKIKNYWADKLKNKYNVLK